MKKQKLNKVLKDNIKRLINSAKIFNNDKDAIKRFSISNGLMIFMGQSAPNSITTHKGTFVSMNSKILDKIVKLIVENRNNYKCLSSQSLNDLIGNLIIKFNNNDSLDQIIFNKITSEYTNYTCIIPIVGCYINKQLNICCTYKGKRYPMWTIIHDRLKDNNRRPFLYKKGLLYVNDVNQLIINPVKARTYKEALSMSMKISEALIGFLVCYKKLCHPFDHSSLLIDKGHRGFIVATNLNNKKHHAIDEQIGHNIHIHNPGQFLYKQKYIEEASNSNEFLKLTVVLKAFAHNKNLTSSDLDIINSMDLLYKSISEDGNGNKFFDATRAIDCLVGKRDTNNLTKILSYNVAVLISNRNNDTRNTQQLIYSKFKKLYNLRSIFAHGNEEIPDNYLKYVPEIQRISIRVFMSILILSSQIASFTHILSYKKLQKYINNNAKISPNLK